MAGVHRILGRAANCTGRLARALLSACAPRRALRPLAGALALAVLLAAHVNLPESAHAAPELTIDWRAAADSADCPDRSWVDGQIAAQLGRPPRPNVNEGVEAQVDIESVPAGLQLTLRTKSGAAAGERVVVGKDCRELSDAAVLIIALAVTDARERESEQQPPPPPPTQPAAPAPRTAALPSSSEPVPGKPRSRFVVRADALLDVGFLDRATAGPALAFGLSHGIWRAELAGLWLLPRTLQGARSQDGTVEASLWAGQLTACALLGSGIIQGGPCAAAELGQARGEGAGSATTRRARNHTLWAAGSLGARLSLRLVSGIALMVQTDLLVSMRRPQFVTAEAVSGARSLVYEPTAAQLRARLGVELRF